MTFDLWNQLLQRYVNDQGQVNYRRWQAEAADELQAWLQETAQAQLPSHADRKVQLACWINLYNALTIYQILKRYPIQSIRPKVFGIPNWLAFLYFFLNPVYTFHHQRYSLNQIEHSILRKNFQEPRIHFALVCASVGCPLLRNQAYLPECVLEQLEADAVRFMNNPDKVHVKDGVLYCSKIFSWYKTDFLAIAPSIPQYIQRYLQTPIPLTANTPIRYLPYDWSLNQQP